MITDAEAEAARIMYFLMDYPVSEIARDFGMMPVSMRAILLNRRHVGKGSRPDNPGMYREDRIHWPHDRAEILNYLQINGPSSNFDLQLCLHYTYNALKYRMQRLKKIRLVKYENGRWKLDMENNIS